MNPDASASSTASALSWREQAARIVEELFPVTEAEVWNALLDLRGEILHGSDWNHALDLFLACREQLEADHYLPFYRLRRLLAASLRLKSGADCGEIAPLMELLRQNPRSFAEMKKALRRELFEHSLDLPAHIPLLVVERH